MHCINRLRVLLLSLSLLQGGAMADPPPTQGGQGTKIHGTGEFEDVSIPLKSFAVVAPGDDPWTYQLVIGTKAVKRATTSTLIEEFSTNPMECKRTISVEKGDLRITTACSSSSSPKPQVTVKEGTDLRNTVFFVSLDNAQQTIFIDKVVEVQRPDKQSTHGPHWKYLVRWHTTRNGQDARPSICQLENGGDGYAYAVPYGWNKMGNLLPDGPFFTFACVPDDAPGHRAKGSAIAKCIDWGYAPWASGEQPSSPKGEQEARRLHEICVHMAIADYCGEGVSNTVDGTQFAFYDLKNVSMRSDLPPAHPVLGFERQADPGYDIEAAWGMNEDKKVSSICLSKTRWNFALAMTCTDGSKRFLGAAQGSVNACESMSVDAILGRGGRLLSYSRVVDTPLVMFDNGSAEYLTTTAVELDPAALTSDGDPVPYRLNVRTTGPSYSHRTKYRQPARWVGSILTPAYAKQIQAKVPVVPLFRCVNDAGQFVLANSQTTCPPGYRLDGREEEALEGYLFKEKGSALEEKPNSALNVYRKGPDGPFAVHTVAPSGYSFAGKILGYLPATDARSIDVIASKTKSAELASKKKSDVVPPQGKSDVANRPGKSDSIAPQPNSQSLRWKRK